MIECIREADVLEAVVFDRLATVREHLATCVTCADIAEVASALRADREAAYRDAHLPSAGLVWWRATIRKRLDAARIAERPISVAQAVAVSGVIALAGALAGAAWRSVRWSDGMNDVIASLSAGRFEGSSGFPSILQHALPLVCGLAVCLLLAPLALYFVLSRD
jgi:hypothetical protein